MSQQSPLHQISVDEPCRYKGWCLYFPNDPYLPNSPIEEMLHVFEKCFISWKELYNRDEIVQTGSFQVNFKELLQDANVLSRLPNLAENLRDKPETVLGCMGLAMHHMLSNKGEEQMKVKNLLNDVTEPYNESLPVIYPRIINYEPVTSLKNLRANFCGKFVSIKGTLVRVGNIKPLCCMMVFDCVTCGNSQVLTLPDGKYVLPTKCASDGCRGRQFTPNNKSQYSKVIDWQTVKLQEEVNGERTEAARIPRIMECELTNDLVDTCIPGDAVTMCGVVKVTNVDQNGGRASRDKCMFLLYIHVNSITTNKGTKTDGATGVAMELEINDLYAIQEVQARPQLFKLLVNSLCPAVYGHELVKSALILALFGGTQKFGNDKNHIPVRGDPHILIVGDPGLGKSQMLQAVSYVAPRAVYVCGNTTTTSGNASSLYIYICQENTHVRKQSFVQYIVSTTLMA